ncbi:MAG: hypothetical protein ACRY3E_03460, partial [Candidatus Lariskella arthropodorum]
NFLHRYTIFNGDFAGGVSNLAGAFHIRGDLFGQSHEPISACSDVSAQIASHIFFAAEDEYACRYNKERVTHRCLGQFLLKETVKYFNINSDEFLTDYTLNSQTKKTLEHVKLGYKVNRINKEIDLYHGLGFHLGSEILADEEFNLIDQYLEKKFTSLVTHLKGTYNGRGQDAYRWIKLHTYAEEEHFDISVKAANIALDNYRGPMRKQEVYDNILQGFGEFADLQQYFFTNILSG